MQAKRNDRDVYATFNESVLSLKYGPRRMPLSHFLQTRARLRANIGYKVPAGTLYFLYADYQSGVGVHGSGYLFCRSSSASPGV